MANRHAFLMNSTMLKHSPRRPAARGRYASIACGIASLVGVAVAPSALASQIPPQPQPPVQARGVIAGQVIDRGTGRPLAYANVVVVGTQLGGQTDLDGRFRITLVPAGVRSVRAMRIGYTPSQVDSVSVTDGATSTVAFALAPAAQELQNVVIEAPPARASSDDGLLAAQKAAPRVSDGISAEAIRRAPGSDAADAIVRVTGVSVIDRKFVVVRGLAERYSNTLLNGVELTSPEPLKKIVPLDLFPSSLLESIVTNKTATPDRPGDFAGGSVEITTKEFPDERVTEMSLSVGYGSEVTFRNVALPAQRGLDYLGFDDGKRRQMPANPPPDFSPDMERFAEAIRNVWTPPLIRAQPDLGATVNIGGQVGESTPFGYAVALTYNREFDHTPNRLSQLVFDVTNGIADLGYVANESSTTVDLGAIANFAVRLGQETKIGWKNLYTRNAEERLSRNTGFETYNGPAERIIYQSRYITRDLVQTQLTGDHLFGSAWDSRLEWKGTASASARDEPENRSLLYFKDLATGEFTQSPSNPSPYWFRFLDDRLYSGQLDWSLPLNLPLAQNSLFKLGGLYRARDRTFDAKYFRMALRQGLGDAEPARLPPEEALAPENIGSVFLLERPGVYALPYASDDDVTAAYTMVDLPLPGGVRLVGGIRVEEWRLNLFQGTREAPLNEPTRRKNRDHLWSGNLTWSLTDRQNIRLAGYRTVARPDPREVSPDYYVSVTGDCANQGNPQVERTRVLNGDLRWEFFPEPGELISVSGFYKYFDRPIVELLSLPGSSECVIVYTNVDDARLFGGELEIRKGLGFLASSLENLAVGVNVTIVQSEAKFRPVEDALLTLRLQGQSDYLANVNLLYSDDDHGFEASVLANAFGDRIVRYGVGQITSTNELRQVPHVMEDGRITVDARVQKRLGRGLSMSLSGRNLTDAEVRFFQDSNVGPVRTGYFRPGMSLSLGMGYAIR